MWKMQGKLVIALGVFAMLGLSVEPARAAEAWAGNRHITYVYPHAGGFTFNYDGAIEATNQACGNRSLLPIAAPNYQAIVSALITAFTAGYVVDINYDDSTRGSCDMIINRIVVKKQ
jgi:hypothetical protein